ncbi:hypothetical protein C8K30_1011076 [Promicromonospora sp. AC04]|uniref:hypothetical protein n=1 Tax=Promicromonospora sp. AC04 TaxID=2135723 RepID=UPI000D3A172D|nr:hypothetical protein [Promicromonospora sp. AC04]PUB32550.1 hypothetical protein C8K30_1011076 [Promicromonospora sp. AC04]
MIAEHIDRRQCKNCGNWFWTGDEHTCPKPGEVAAAYLPPAVLDPASIPDPDRPHVAGLTWFAPLESRPIPLGPGAGAPALHPALHLAADRYWSGAGYGLAVGRARIAMDSTAIEYALSASLERSPHLAAALAETASVWNHALRRHAEEFAS